MPLHPLVEKHRNLIESEAAKHAKFLPLHVVEAEAYHIAHTAANSFNEKSGTQFSTHLTSQLRKLSRLSTEYGGAVRLPEKTQFELNTINKFKEDYQGAHGREPSVAEISRGTKIPLAKVNKILKGSGATVTLSSLVHDPVFVDHKGQLDDWIHMVYHDLPERDKLIFEHYTGFGGRKPAKEGEIAKMLNISPALVNKRLKVIGNEIAKGVK